MPNQLVRFSCTTLTPSSPSVASSPEVAREKDHVTGLYYAEAENALVVYVDAQAWGTNLTMMREILRTRMEFQGARVSKIVVRVSREGYRRR